MVPSANRESSTPCSGAWHSLQGRTCLAQRLPSFESNVAMGNPLESGSFQGEIIYKWWIFHYRRLKTSPFDLGGTCWWSPGCDSQHPVAPCKGSSWAQRDDVNGAASMPCTGDGWNPKKKTGLGMTWLTVCEVEHHHRNVVNFPINSMVIVQFVMLVHQRVDHGIKQLKQTHAWHRIELHIDPQNLASNLLLFQISKLNGFLHVQHCPLGLPLPKISNIEDGFIIDS
jgi:hypothetical protein